VHVGPAAPGGWSQAMARQCLPSGAGSSTDCAVPTPLQAMAAAGSSCLAAGVVHMQQLAPLVPAAPATGPIVVVSAHPAPPMLVPQQAPTHKAVPAAALVVQGGCTLSYGLPLGGPVGVAVDNRRLVPHLVPYTNTQQLQHQQDQPHFVAAGSAKAVWALSPPAHQLQEVVTSAGGAWGAAAADLGTLAVASAHQDDHMRAGTPPLMTDPPGLDIAAVAAAPAPPPEAMAAASNGALQEGSSSHRHTAHQDQQYAAADGAFTPVRSGTNRLLPAPRRAPLTTSPLTYSRRVFAQNHINNKPCSDRASA
jgi:hypothetical protein